MAHLMPQSAIEVTVGRQLLRLLFADGGRKGSRSTFEDVWLAHDVRSQQDRTTVTSGQETFVRENRCGIAATCLTKVGNHVVDTHRNIFANPLVILIRKRVLECLQT